jgi:hypothetical protein
MNKVFLSTFLVYADDGNLLGGNLSTKNKKNRNSYQLVAVRINTKKLKKKGSCLLSVWKGARNFMW